MPVAVLLSTNGWLVFPLATIWRQSSSTVSTFASRFCKSCHQNHPEVQKFLHDHAPPPTPHPLGTGTNPRVGGNRFFSQNICTRTPREKEENCLFSRRGQIVFASFDGSRKSFSNNSHFGQRSRVIFIHWG